MNSRLISYALSEGPAWNDEAVRGPGAEKLRPTHDRARNGQSMEHKFRTGKISIAWIDRSTTIVRVLDDWRVMAGT